MKINQKAIRALAASIAFTLLILCVVAGLERVLMDSRSRKYIGDELPAGALDAAFIGSSHIYRTVNPQLLYDEFGIVSADIATPGQDLDGNLQAMLAMYRQQSPAVIVVDLYGATAPKYNWVKTMPTNIVRVSLAGQYAVDESVVRKLSAFNPLKYQFAIRDAQKNPDAAAYTSALALLHGQWSDLSRGDYAYAANEGVEYTRLGYEVAPAVFDPASRPIARHGQDVLDSVTLTQAHQAGLQALIDCANDHGSELVFIAAPYFAEETELLLYDKIHAWLTRRGIPVLGMDEIRREAGLINEQDFSDRQHMNDSGAAKATRWLGQYLQATFALPDRRLESGVTYGLWERRPKSYEADAAAGRLSKIKSFAEYTSELQKLNDDYIVVIASNGLNHEEFDAGAAGALEAMGLQQARKYLDTVKCSYCAVLRGTEPLHEQAAVLGKGYELYTQADGHPLSITSDSGASLAVRLNGQLVTDDKLGLHIVVYNKLTCATEDSVTFNFSREGMPASR